MIQIVQTALGQTTAPATALSVPLPHPTTVGNLLVLQLRFSPRTGSPKLSDSYGNRYDRLATTEISAELSTFTTAQLAQLQTLLTVQTILVGNSATQAKFDSLLANFATSKAAVQATYTRTAGPWEVYFGKGNLATVGLLDAARNSNGGNQF